GRTTGPPGGGDSLGRIPTGPGTSNYPPGMPPAGGPAGVVPAGHSNFEETTALPKPVPSQLPPGLGTRVAPEEPSFTDLQPPALPPGAGMPPGRPTRVVPADIPGVPAPLPTPGAGPVVPTQVPTLPPTLPVDN